MGKIVNFNFGKVDQSKELSDFKLNATEAGLDNYLYTSLHYERVNNLNLIDRNSFDNLEKKLICNVVDNEFLSKVLNRIDLIKRYGSYDIKSNSLSGRIGGKYNYFTEIEIKDDKVTFTTENQSKITTGEYKMNTDTYEVNYKDIKSKDVHFLERDEDYFTRNIKEVSSVYNFENIELSRKETIENQNYFFDKDKNKKELIPTDTRENTIETKEYYRRGNKVLHYYELKFLNKDYKFENGEFIFNKNLINKEEYYIADNFRMDDKQIPKMLFFERCDYEIFENLKNENVLTFKKKKRK